MAWAPPEAETATEDWQPPEAANWAPPEAVARLSEPGAFVPGSMPPATREQSPLETGLRSVAMEPGRSAARAYSGVGRVRQQLSDIIGQNTPDFLGKLPQQAFDLATFVPRLLAPIATDIADESQRVYAPDAQRNPKAAAVGSGLGQAPGMVLATIAAGPAGPMALGAAQGADAGIAQAEEMGITSPAKKLALGAAYGGIELATEKLGGFGTKALTTPVKRTLAESLKAAGKTVLSESIEEPIAGIGQDAAAAAFAPESYETTELRPFVMSPEGVPVPNQSYWQRRQLETIGGAAGGAGGAVFQAIHNRAQPAAPPPGAVPDPLAAHAATMPAQAWAPPEADLATAQPTEGDLLTDFNVPPAVAGVIDPGTNTPGSLSRATVPAFTDPNELSPVTPAAGNAIKEADDRRQSWADQVIRASMETPFIGIDPKLAAAYTVKGAQLIREGFTSFAKWSREMLNRFGAAVKGYIDSVWQAVQTEARLMKTNKGFVANPFSNGQINLTHAAEAARMEAEGKEALPTGGQGTVEEWEAEAAERVQQPGAAGALVTDILNQQRTATPVEHYMLMNYAAALDSELARVDGILADPGATPEARAAAAEIKRTQDAERDRVAVAAQLAGSKAGAALGARARGLDRSAVPSLSKMVADITLIQDPTGRTPLPPEERVKIEQVHAKLVSAEAAVEKQSEEGVGGARNTYNEELQKLLKEAQEELAAHKEQLARQAKDIENAMKPRPAAIKSKSILKRVMDEADAAEQRLRAAGFFGGTTNIGIDPSMILDLAKVGAGYIARGIDFTLAMTQKFGEQIRPFINQIRDTSERLLNEEKAKKTPDDIKAKMRATVAKGKDLPGDIARKFALAHIVDHLERGDKTLSAEKIAKLVAADLQEFLPGITERQARDLISGYGKTSTQSQEEARKTLRDLAAQMQKLTQLEALMNKERLLKSGPQRDPPSARLRELQKQVEALKKDVGYESRSKEEELKSARDRIKKSLENQIEELQRILAGKAAPVTQRDKIAYDADLNALKTLRNSLKDLVAELPEHKLATEARRNKAALKSALASEAEWNRRAKAMEWTRPGNKPKTFTDEVNAAKAKAKEARANFEALKKAADPRNDPEARALREYKSRVQSQINGINEKIRTGAFDPPKKTPRQIKHDAESDKLRHELEMKKREWIDLKLQHRIATMGWGEHGLELVRKLYHLTRSIKAGGEFSGVLNQGIIPMVTHPLLTFGSIPQMFRAFVSPQNETSINLKIWARGNAINGRYKKHRLAINDPMDYSAQQAEGNYRSAWGNKLPYFAGTGRAYTTLLNHMRADLFDHLVEKLEMRKARRGETITDRELDMIAEEVNDSTGHGKLGFGKREITGSAKDVLGAFVFSPAFVMARARYLAGASLWGGTMDSRRVIAEERIRTMAGFAALYALALALQGDDDDEMNATDPRDSTFMKVRYGKTYVDLLGGLQQVAVLFTRLAKGEKASNGKVTSLNDPKGRSDRGDVLMQFAKSKRSPAAAFVWDAFISGKDYTGKPTTIGTAALDMIDPMTRGNIADIMRAEEAKRAAALSAGAMFGLRTSTYEPKH